MPLACKNDSECGEGQVCFADGCGDPGRDLVVEVTPNPQAGLHAQDFPIDLHEAHPTLQLRGPAALAGQVLRDVGADGGVSAELYAAPVTVRATGESVLLPGVERRYESTVTPDNGTYRFPVGVGAFNVSLVPADPALPPLTESRSVSVGTEVALDFRLPAEAELTALTGLLVREPAAPFDADVDVQLLDPALKPLSQRVAVSRTTGAFTLFLTPAARALPQVLLQATPRSEGSLLPQKTFSYNPKTPDTSFSLGDFGSPTTLEATVVGPDELPVAGATVRLSGPVEGGGLFRSRTVTTDAAGHFVLPTLPSAAGKSFLLTIAPPARPAAGSSPIAAVTQTSVEVSSTGTTLPSVVCFPRGQVFGTLLLPDGKPAPNVRVIAVPEGPVAGRPAPAEGPETTSDAQGKFELRLDPAEYRLDFVPSVELPRVSRYLSVVPGPNGGFELPVVLPSFALSQGRQISGPVRLAAEGLREPNLPYASVRFFRVVNVNGRPTSQLLAQTVSDANGEYEVTLPTR